MQKIINHYKLYKNKDKEFIYKGTETLVYANQLKRWISTHPDTIKRILCDERFSVIDYKFEKITTRFDIAMDEVIKICPYIPLSFDGPQHLELRKKIALLIAQQSESALLYFESQIEEQLNLLLKDNITFDIQSDLLKPLVQDTIVRLANCKNPKHINIDSLASIFDETASIPLRKSLNDMIYQCKINLEKNDEDDIYFKVAFISLGIDSSLGTLSESLLSVLIKNKDIKLSEIDWPHQIPATGVPVIERIANTDLEINGIQITKGDRVRLYLDAAGYQNETPPHYASLYFGSGNHACLGASISKKFWMIFIKHLSKFHKYMTIEDIVPRVHDNVFNTYNSIKVKIYDHA